MGDKQNFEDAFNVSNSGQASELRGVRYHFLDNLRALAMLAGVLLHIGLGYSAFAHEFWPTADRSYSSIPDYLIWPLHTFRMPLFFLIAGFFAHYLVVKRGLSGFLKNRALRITLPFVIFWPLVMVMIVAVFFQAAKYPEISTPILDLFRSGAENPEAMEGKQQPLSTAHLWFIYYLTMLGVLSAVMVRYLPRIEFISKYASHPLALLVVLPLLTFLSLLNVSIPHPAPESFIPSVSQILFFGLFYWLGWELFKNRGIFNTLNASVVPMLIVAVIACAVFIKLLPAPVKFEEIMAAAGQSPEWTPNYLIRVATTAILAWHLSFLCLVGAKRFMDWKSPLLRYITDGSYWVYIIHVPIVFGLQAYFHTLDWPMISEFLCMTGITFGISYLSYAIMVRHTPIGWMLNGRKFGKKAKAELEAKTASA